MRAAGRRAGDFADPREPSALAAQRSLADAPWTWLRQVHGRRVVIVEQPGDCRAEEADAAISACPGAALVVVTADCAPVGLASPEGIFGVVHAGWRGLMSGVVESAVATMRSLGASDVSAALGPCISPHAYRFSAPDLEPVAERFGPGVVALDSHGFPALDLPATVRAALDRSGATLVGDSRICTHCSPDHWSWRTNGDKARQASVVWVPGQREVPAHGR